MKTKALVVISLAVILSLLVTPLTTIAETFPNKPVTMIVPYGAGGGTDTMGRVLAKALQKELGQPVVVVNRKGGGGAVGASYLKNAPADGYTFLMGGDDIPTWIPLTKNVNFKFEDYRYLAALTEYQQALITKSEAPYNNLDELIAYAKKNPGMSVAYTGPMDKALIKIIAEKEKLVLKYISVGSGSEIAQLLLGNKLDFSFSGGIHNRYEGKLKVLCSFNKARLGAHPDKPSIYEKYGVNMPSYVLFMTPAGVPDNVAKTLENALLKAGQDKDFKTLVKERLKAPVISINSADLTKDVTKLYEQLKTMAK
jgi:tripartite-type tricarboxylate transporter receptor subunit TctC